MQEQLMVSAPKQAHAMGKSVRGCDNCVTKGARWYCTADDAFLCESCDSSVHTANPLARRHERVRLKIASEEGFKAHTPSWHQGFTRKARTPRQKRQGNPIRVVPEQELVSEEESEEQLLYRVPVMESKSIMNQFLLPLELDFAADMLGQDLDLELNCDINMEGLGILEGMEEKVCCFGIIKGEDEEIGGQNQIDHVDYFTYDEEDETENKTQNQEMILRNECKVDDSNKALLKLDYERVISAWDDMKSPWTTGEKPEFSPHGWWPAADCCLGTSGTMLGAYGGGEMMRTGSGQVTVDGGREARVSRYREKRRTRLFSKKIRYEVRKLNAEKRPRMKGRFVKRSTSFGASAFPLLNKY